MTEEKTRLVLFPGCVMSTEQYGYEISLRKILPMLDVELVDIPDFSCCGEPMKSVNTLMTLYLSARNIAIAKKEELDLFVPCVMCHLALSEAMHILDADEDMKRRINEKLAGEDLEYTGGIRLWNTVDLLYDKIGLERLKESVETPLKDLKVATHYGCHLLRPSIIGRPVDSEDPVKMEEIVGVLGGSAPWYPEKLDCCGGIVQFNKPDAALTKTGQKLEAVSKGGFDCLVDVCPWCHRMFDSKQKKAADIVGAKFEVPVVYLSQLVGIALGCTAEELGMQLNLSDMDKLMGAL